MLRYVKFIVGLIFFGFKGNEAARILAVFPTPSFSHQVVFRPLVRELAKRGHEVIIVTTDPVYPKGKAPQNLTEIDVHDMSYKLWSDFLKTTTGSNELYDQMKVGFELIGKIFIHQMETEEVQHVLKEGHFDLLMLEALSRPALALSHIFKVPVIQVSSFGAVMGNYENMGAPVHPMLYPTLFRQKIVNLTLWEKASELYNHFAYIRLHESMVDFEDGLVRSVFGADVPSVTELGNNVDMMFLNVHPMFESNRPVPPSVIYMGGIHQNPVKELPKDLKEYLDGAKNGVIYISFGTNVNPSTLPPECIRVMTTVLSKLPYDVLWKWDKDELPGRTANIKISKWLPQSDLLRHPNIKLFITQGGLQSTDEAITAGVPLVGVPILADQWYNVEQYRIHKIGMRLDLGSLTEEKLRSTVQTVIEDKSYRQNVARLRTLMRDQPQSPLERAIWWTEYVIRHRGAKHLRSPAVNISWAEYLELELVFTLLFLGVSSVVALTGILYFAVKIVRRNYLIDVKLKSG